MSATGQPAEGTATEPEAPSAPAAPTEAPAAPAGDQGLDRLYARMDAMAQQQQQLADTFAQLTTPVEEEDESLYYTDEGDLTEEGARAVIGDLVREQVEAQMAPREKARLTSERDDAYDALRDEYPELQDEAVAGPVLAAAVQWAQASNNTALIERPEFVDVIEWVYRSNKFETLSAAQAAEQPRPVVLESGSGAARQQRPNEPDWGDRIVKAAERLRPQI